jgi:hypothetical protein
LKTATNENLTGFAAASSDESEDSPQNVNLMAKRTQQPLVSRVQGQAGGGFDSSIQT